MGGTETTRGIGYQNAYSLWRVLELLDDSKRLASVTVEGTGPNIEDLTLAYRDGAEEIVQVKTCERKRGSPGQWSPGKVLDVIRELHETGSDGRNIVAFRFVATGNVPPRITALDEACRAIRDDASFDAAHKNALAEICSLIGASEDDACEFMRRLWIHAPHESEDYFEKAVQNLLMAEHEVSPSEAPKTYRDLFKRVFDKAKPGKPQDRTIRKEDLLGWIGGRRWRDREELLKELSAAVPDFSAHIEERTKNFTGRDWVFKKIGDWLADDKAPRFFLLTGEPGIGKTAIAGRLTQIRPVSAMQFCIAGQADTIDPTTFARSIACQLTGIDGFTDCLLKEREGRVGATLAADSAAAAFNRLVLAPLTRLCRDGHKGQVLIVVDALDEAAQREGRETIVDLLAGAHGLPDSVRFVLTSRPEGAVKARFDESSVPYLLLEAKSGENLSDVRQYLGNRLKESRVLRRRLRDGNVSEGDFVTRVEQASAGNFLYVVMLLAAIEKGTQRLDAKGALPSGLEGIFRKHLASRRIGRSVETWRERYRLVMGTLAAAREPLAARQLAGFTGLKGQTVGDVLQDVEQFLKPGPTGKRTYELYHQSLADFLSDEAKAGPFWVDIAAVHERMADFYLSGCRGNWAACDDYGLKYLPSHLMRAGRAAELKKLLLDFGWIEAKLARTDPNAVVVDYDLVQDDRELRLVQGALRLSSNALEREKPALRSQMYGRLMSFRSDAHPGIAAILKEITASAETPWLRPTTASLTAPGGPLLRTLEGHSDRVTAVAVFGGGGNAISASWDHTLKVWDLEASTVLTTFAADAAIYACAVSPDGRTIAAGDQAGRIHILRLEEPRKPARNRAPSRARPARS